MSFRGLKHLGIGSQLKLFEMQPAELESVQQIIDSIQPQEVYNLAAQSSVNLSFIKPAETFRSITLTTLNVLEAIRNSHKKARFYNAGSGEVFGKIEGHPADEETRFNPVSPYGLAKATSTRQVEMYRDIYGLYACTGILFNHESELRPTTYVTKKIISAACRIGSGSKEKLELGNINICRDWGYAPEYVDAMWQMLQQQDPQDFVIATGTTKSLKYFINQAFLYFGLNWEDHVVIKSSLMRPAEIEVGSANPTKAKKILGWKAKNNLSDIVNHMIRHELAE
jgi:GDPmannose 4,6-dehydratase